MAHGKSVELQDIPKNKPTLLWNSKTLGTFSPKKPQYMTDRGKTYLKIMTNYYNSVSKA